MENTTPSLQKKLLRVRPDRVTITYDIETGGQIQKKELPFIIGVMAGLSGDHNSDHPLPDLASRKFIPVDKDGFAELIQTIRPQVSLESITCCLPGSAAGNTLSGSVSFASLQDMEPAALIKNIPAMQVLDVKRASMAAGEERTVIDKAITEQLKLIYQLPAFQQLEASWRQLAWLISQVNTGAHLQVQVLNISKEEWMTDLEKTEQPDQSALYQKIYAAAQGTYGGIPYGLLLADFYISYSAREMETLKKMATLSAANSSPFVAAAEASLFGLNDFSVLNKPRSIAKIFEAIELESYHEFLTGENANYVTLLLPQVLLRGPLENTEPLLWGNPVWLLAERVANAISLHNWPAAITGEENGGRLSDLVSFSFTDASGTAQTLGPLSVSVTEAREKELYPLGFTPLCTGREKETAVLYRNISNAGNCPLPYLLAATRFAQYMQVIMREKIGSFLTRTNVEDYLNNWIAQYVLLDDAATEEQKAAFPLREAKAVVTDLEGSPGAYNITLFIKPHFMLPVMTGSLRLLFGIGA